jgi:hypothetical protein
VRLHEDVGAKLHFHVGAMGHVKVLVSKVLIEVEKVMVAVMRGSNMAERHIGGDKDMRHKFFLCVGCLVSYNSGLRKRG